MSTKVYSIRVRVRRTTHEYADVSVPLEAHVVNEHVDADAVFRTAVRLAGSADTQWKADGVSIIEPHPIQGGSL